MKMISTVEMREVTRNTRVIDALVSVRGFNREELDLLARCVAERERILAQVPRP